MEGDGAGAAGTAGDGAASGVAAGGGGVVACGGGEEDVSETLMDNFWPKSQCLLKVQMKWRSPLDVKAMVVGPFVDMEIGSVALHES